MVGAGLEVCLRLFEFCRRAGLGVGSQVIVRFGASAAIRLATGTQILLNGTGRLKHSFGTQFRTCLDACPRKTEKPSGFFPEMLRPCLFPTEHAFTWWHNLAAAGFEVIPFENDGPPNFAQEMARKFKWPASHTRNNLGGIVRSGNAAVHVSIFPDPILTPAPPVGFFQASVGFVTVSGFFQYFGCSWTRSREEKKLLDIVLADLKSQGLREGPWAENVSSK